METVVIYRSKYGTTRRYAEWIAQALDGQLLEASQASPTALMQYDTIIYGGGLYAGRICGLDLITKNYAALREKKLIVFTVGITDPLEKDQLKAVVENNLTAEISGQIPIFHLRGGIDYQKLKLRHKAMMRMLVHMIKGKKPSELDDTQRLIVQTYGKLIDFTERETIAPIVAYVAEAQSAT